MVNRLPRYQRYPARASVLMPNRLRVGGSGTGAWCPCINDRLVGEEGKLLRLAETRLGQPDGISPSRMAEMLEVDKAGAKVRC